jgi:hypothetical protein
LLTRLAVGYRTNCTFYIVYRCIGHGAIVTWCVSVTSQRNITRNVMRNATFTSLLPVLKHFMLKVLSKLNNTICILNTVNVLVWGICMLQLLSRYGVCVV